jgi:hypothetical protein
MVGKIIERRLHNQNYNASQVESALSKIILIIT